MCAKVWCTVFDILWKNRADNKNLKGLDPAMSLEAGVAHSTQKRSDHETMRYMSRKQISQTLFQVRDPKSGIQVYFMHL